MVLAAYHKQDHRDPIPVDSGLKAGANLSQGTIKHTTRGSHHPALALGWERKLLPEGKSLKHMQDGGGTQNPKPRGKHANRYATVSHYTFPKHTFVEERQKTKY